MVRWRRFAYIIDRSTLQGAAAKEGEQMDYSFEYMIVYLTPSGKRAGLYKGMNKDELDKVLESLKMDGCIVEKVEIVRRAGV
jgi:hypothetical protein